MKRSAKVPRYFRITARGKWFIFVTVAVGAAAINTGHNLIYLCLALNLSLLITSGMLSDLATRKVIVEVDRKTIHRAGDRGSLILLTLKNDKKILPLYHVETFLHVEGETFGAVVDHVPPGESRLKFIPVRFRRRGIKVIRRVTIKTSFPFGLFEKYYHVKTSIKLLVAPAAGTSHLDERKLRNPSEETSTNPRETTRATGGHSFRDIREYQPSDPMKLIMWKKYAEKGKLYVKIPEDDAFARIKIHVKANPHAKAFEEHLERVAAIIDKLRREGTPFEISFEDVTLEFDRNDRSFRKILAALALVPNDGRIGPWMKTVEELTA